jgi:RNase P subunit RPR2
MGPARLAADLERGRSLVFHAVFPSILEQGGRREKIVIASAGSDSVQSLALHRFERSGTRSPHMALTCPNCGNARTFLVKTLQMHVVRLEDARVEVTEENRPGVLEILCDECDTALNFEEIEDSVRKDILLTLGAK